MCRSLLAGNQRSLIEARPINGLTDSAECFEPLLTTLLCVEELPHSLFKQFVGAVKTAASEFLLDLLSQVRWQRDVQRLFPCLLFYACCSMRAVMGVTSPCGVAAVCSYNTGFEMLRSLR